MIKLLEIETIIDDLNSLYNDRGAWVYDNIIKLVQKYRPIISNEKNDLTEKDVILITYGDNVKKEGNSHLNTLKSFVNEFCLPEINSTHILPFYPYTSDDGFSITNYYQVDPNLGSWDDVSNLSKSTNLMFDAVINHMSKSSDWFQSFLALDEDFKDFFIAVNPALDLSKVVRPRALPLLTPFKDITGKERHIWTTFSEDQVDLNYEAPEVFIAVLDVLLFYISKGSKFIRLDAIAFLWKIIGTDCLHLEQTHLAIKLYKKVIQALTKNVSIITETNVPHEENISYFGNGHDEADLVYNFTLAPLLAYSIMKGNVNVLTNWAQSLEFPSNKVCFFNFTASHDGIGMRPIQNIIPNKEVAQLAKLAELHGGHVSYKNNEDGSQSPYELNCNYMDFLSSPEDLDELRTKKMMLTQAIMISMPGVPGIYFHSLVGSRNFNKGVEESGIKRRINREKLNYDTLKQELSIKGSLRNNIFTTYKKLLSIRTQETAFNPFGAAAYMQVNDKVFIIKREHNNETVFTIYNFSNTLVKMESLSEDVVDLVQKKELKQNVWEIAPYQFYWYKKN
jgi:sucrose phosphorylase